MQKQTSAKAKAAQPSKLLKYSPEAFKKIMLKESYQQQAVASISNSNPSAQAPKNPSLLPKTPSSTPYAKFDDYSYVIIRNGTAYPRDPTDPLGLKKLPLYHSLETVIAKGYDPTDPLGLKFLPDYPSKKKTCSEKENLSVEHSASSCLSRTFSLKAPAKSSRARSIFSPPL